MPYFYYDWTMILVIPGLLLGLCRDLRTVPFCFLFQLEPRWRLSVVFVSGLPAFR